MRFEMKFHDFLLNLKLKLVDTMKNANLTWIHSIHFLYNDVMQIHLLTNHRDAVRDGVTQFWNSSCGQELDFILHLCANRANEEKKKQIRIYPW